MTDLPIVAITIGDPAGVGPEIVAATLALGGVEAVCRPLVVGDGAVLERAARTMGVTLPLHPVASPAQASGPYWSSPHSIASSKARSEILGFTRLPLARRPCPSPPRK